jgi:hypothetical protein
MFLERVFHLRTAQHSLHDLLIGGHYPGEQFQDSMQLVGRDDNNASAWVAEDEVVGVDGDAGDGDGDVVGVWFGGEPLSDCGSAFGPDLERIMC